MTAPSIIAKSLRSVGSAYLRWQRQTLAERRAPVGRAHARWTVLAGMVAIVALAAGAAFVAGPSLEHAERPAMVRTVAVTPPDLSRTVAALTDRSHIRTASAIVRTGETLLSLFAELGIRDPQAAAFVRRTPEARAIVLPQTGQFVSAGTHENGRLAYLRLYLEGPSAGDGRTVEVFREGEDLAVRTLPYTFEARETLLSGTYEKSWAKTVRTMGIPQNVAETLQHVWEGGRNPVNDLQEGDRIRLVYEKEFADGDFVRNGNLVAVQIVRGDEVSEAFRFTSGRAAGFYTLDGRSASQTFMRVPLDVKDVSSEFSPLRRHPVTGVLRAHNGTDLRAPTGSRIFASADGVIRTVAYEARGYGRYIKIDHGLGRTTVYAHMSKIARGMRVGRHVEKGEVIGYVGMTGLTTGPHLHYELLIDGVQINPKTADLPDTENLSPYQSALLRARAVPYGERFDAAAKSEGEPLPSELKREKALRDAEARKVADAGADREEAEREAEERRADQKALEDEKAGRTVPTEMDKGA